MQLKHGLHLAYCTNVHRGETWAETFASLNEYTLAVKQRVCADKPYAIGLRLSNQASLDLSDKGTLNDFKKWLEKNSCYVFTMNGFPFGRFHGTRVKEAVHLPDWTSEERVAYTNRLFDLMAELVPEGVEGSVSTSPGSFKEFVKSAEQERDMRDNFWRCVEHIAKVSEKSGKRLHLGVEPEPLGWIENSQETIRLFEQMRKEHPNDERLDEHLGVNYDTCHFAIEYEEPAEAIGVLRKNGIKISKLHLSSALKLKPTPAARKHLEAFADDIYLHQVVARKADGTKNIHVDLAPALKSPSANDSGEEWRIHFHVPLHSPDAEWCGTTSDHVTGVLDLLKADPAMCSHLEMETYTWEVLPKEMKDRSVVDQLTAEYDWTLNQLRKRGLL